jgi:hydrogenase 3 maturation protease
MAQSLSFPTPRPPRVAILGVGNEMNGDDGAGVRVVKALADRLAATPGLLLINGATAPENCTGPLRRFRPDLIVEIDAADQDEPPGTLAWIDWRDADGMSASTHTLPPSVLATFLTTDLGCQMTLIGIQPVSLETGDPLSPAVEAAVNRLVTLMAAWLSCDPASVRR